MRKLNIKVEKIKKQMTQLLYRNIIITNIFSYVSDCAFIFNIVMLRRLYLRYLFSSKKSGDQIINPTHQKQQQLKKQPKRKLNLLKLKRKQLDHNKIVAEQPTYQSYEHLSLNEKNYQKNIEEKLKSNQATRNYYQYEMERGEDLIDDVPVDPYYQYRLSDLKNQLQHQKQKIKRKKIMTDPTRLEKLRNIILNYQGMKHQYQVQQFYKKLKQYPGSVKGGNPQDDPEAFHKYVLSIMTQNVKASLQLASSAASTSNTQSFNRVNSSNQYAKKTGYTNVTDYLGRNRKIDAPQSDNQLLLDVHGFKGQQPPAIIQYQDVPLLPYTQFEEYHSYMQKVKMWGKFRQHYDQINQEKKLRQLQEALSNIQQARIKKDGKYITLKPSIYSLYTYYKTLPKEMQEHPGVRTVYLGLEYSQPDIPYQEKEQILNQACKMALPLDRFSDAAMTQLLSKTRKQYLTPHLTDRLFNINPEFTWDIHEFLTEVKDQKLRSISTVKQKQESFPEPPALQNRWQEGMANLPVDFYDNEDGFWDDHIDEKLKRYQQVQPLSKREKKHFIH